MAQEIEYGTDGCLKWERVIPPFWWDKGELLVVADRHLEDGTRQHMVLGNVAPGTVLHGAQIVGESDCVDAEYSTGLSHLGKSMEEILSMNYDDLYVKDFCCVGRISRLLNDAGHCDRTVCPECGVDDFTHVEGCSKLSLTEEI